MIEESFLPPCSYCVSFYPPSVAICSLHKALFVQFHVYKQYIAMKHQSGSFTGLERGRQMISEQELIYRFEADNCHTEESLKDFWESRYAAY